MTFKCMLSLHPCVHIQYRNSSQQSTDSTPDPLLPSNIFVFLEGFFFLMCLPLILHRYQDIHDVLVVVHPHWEMHGVVWGVVLGGDGPHGQLHGPTGAASPSCPSPNLCGLQLGTVSSGPWVVAGGGGAPSCQWAAGACDDMGSILPDGLGLHLHTRPHIPGLDGVVLSSIGSNVAQ